MLPSLNAEASVPYQEFYTDTTHTHTQSRDTTISKDEGHSATCKLQLIGQREYLLRNNTLQYLAFGLLKVGNCEVKVQVTSGIGQLSSKKVLTISRFPQHSFARAPVRPKHAHNKSSNNSTASH